MINLVRSFRKNGFVVIPQLVGQNTIRQIGAAYDEMMNIEVGVRPISDPRGKKPIREIAMPSAHHPIFRDNAALDAGREVARKLLGVDKPVRVFDLLGHVDKG